MKDNNYKNKIMTSMPSLLNKSSALKLTLIKHKVFGDELDEDVIKNFKIILNNILSDWSDITKEIEATLSDIKVESIIDNGSLVIEYDYMKRLIFGKYDYNSIYDFVDGVYQGLNDGNMSKSSDIDNFFTHATNMAFGTNVESISELIECSSSDTLSLHKIGINQMEIKMFNNIRNYDMFNVSDRTTIYKNITDILNIISSNKLSNELNEVVNNTSIKFDLSKKWKSIIDGIVDYMLFMTLIYVTRIYTIKQYVDGFKINEVTTLIESVDLVDTTPENESEVFSTIDETVIKDPKKNKEFFDNFSKIIETPKFEFKSSDDKDDLSKGLRRNDLIEILMDDSGIFYGSSNDCMNEFHHMLKCATFNPKQSLSKTSSSKNELLGLIRMVDYNGKPATMETYKGLIYDLYKDSNIISNRIIMTIDKLNNMITIILPNSHSSNTIGSGPLTPINDIKKLQECLLILITLYEDFMLAVQQKMIYFERCINRIKNSKGVDIESMFKLDDRFKNIDHLNAITGISVPETLRMPPDTRDVFTLTAFEEACINDELLRLTPGFENNSYLLEAESSIINTLVSLIQGLVNSASIFFFKNFKPASDWVIKNKQTLLQIQFNKDDKISNTHKYKIDIQNKTFNGLDVFKLNKSLGGYNKEEVAKDEEKWIKSLYPSDDIYEWFKSNPDTAPIKYRNKILFNIDSDKQVEPVELSGAELKTEFDIWVNDIIQADAIATILINSGKEINQTIKTIKSKSIMEAVILEADITPPESNDSKTNKKEDPSIEPKVEITSSPMPKIIEVVNNIWKPLYDSMIKVYSEEYRNIKLIYQKVKKDK